MRVGVIGAGLAGLTAARRLAVDGHGVQVFDKARGPSGRMSTRRRDDASFDHGAQYFTARDGAFAAEVESWRERGLVAPWTGRVVRLESGKVEWERGETERFVGVPRMSAIGRALSEGLDVQFGQRIERVERMDDEWAVWSDAGFECGRFDWLVIATPAPQAVPLLWAAPDLEEAADAVRMQPCHAAMGALRGAHPVRLRRGLRRFSGVVLGGVPGLEARAEASHRLGAPLAARMERARALHEHRGGRSGDARVIQPGLRRRPARRRARLDPPLALRASLGALSGSCAGRPRRAPRGVRRLDARGSRRSGVVLGRGAGRFDSRARGSALKRVRGLHWFRNDLRLRDNRAIEALADRVDEWLPVFVLDPQLLSSGASRPRDRFLRDSVVRLRADLEDRGATLHVERGDPAEVLARLVAETGAAWVSHGEADTPLGRRRDAQVARTLSARGARMLVVRDHTVFAPEEILTRTGGHYAVYTPFRNAWWRAWEAAPRLPSRRLRLPTPMPRVDSPSLASEALAVTGPAVSDDAAQRLPAGGEAAARRRLAKFLERRVARYVEDRDRPELDATSRLSPYLRFGAISARTCFARALDHAARHPEAGEGVRKWLDELVWREFYAGVLARSPRVLVRCHRPEYDALAWEGTDEQFEAWRQGRTGYPFVDAGMRQLQATGFMHNRVRMIVASFLTKDLLIDWRRGAAWFYEALVDGDPASNNGGWQWAASTGTDAQPYFRIFNPVAQGERWDPGGAYVRRWVPELRDVPNRFVHAPWLGDRPSDYPPPIVDHKKQRARALELYRSARGASR